jgi:hypothetical protein
MYSLFYLDSRSARLLQQYIFRFHITMYYSKLRQSVQTLEQTVRELPHELKAEALERVLLYQLVQVDREQLERDAHVTPEREVVQHVNDVHGVVLVLLPEVFEDPHLLLCLIEEAQLIPDHLKRDELARLVVEHLEHLPEAAPADHLDDFVPENGYVGIRKCAHGVLLSKRGYPSRLERRVLASRIESNPLEDATIVLIVQSKLIR